MNEPASTETWAWSTKTPRKLGDWRYVESIHKDGWYVDNGREIGPVFIESTETSAAHLCEYLTEIEAKAAALEKRLVEEAQRGMANGRGKLAAEKEARELELEMQHSAGRNVELLAELLGTKAALDDARTALEDLGCFSVSDIPCRDRTDGYEGCVRCAALASIDARLQVANDA